MLNPTAFLLSQYLILLSGPLDHIPHLSSHLSSHLLCGLIKQIYLYRLFPFPQPLFLCLNELIELMLDLLESLDNRLAAAMGFGEFDLMG